MDYEYKGTANGIRQLLWRQIDGENFLFAIGQKGDQTAYCRMDQMRIKVWLEEREKEYEKKN